MENKELYHYGVKGMRWGVRRTPAQLGHTPASKRKIENGPTLVSKIKSNRVARKTAKLEKKEAEKAKKKSISEMTDEELNQKIARMELEKRYRDLYAQTVPQSSKKGKDFAMKILERSGENLLTQVANHYGAKTLNQLIGEEAIFANNKKK